MEYHPDKTQGDKQKEDTFKQIAEAYKILSNEDARSNYDASLIRSPLHASIDDVLHEVFADMATTFAQTLDVDQAFSFYTTDPIPFSHVFQQQWIDTDLAKEPTTPLEKIDVDVTLGDVMFGAKKTVDYTITDICFQCQLAQHSSDSIHCMYCTGSGKSSGIMSRRCMGCGGVGFISRKEKPCSVCRNQRSIRTTKSIAVHIPKGVPDKHEFLMKGKGSWDAEKGAYEDVIIRVCYMLPSHIRVNPEDRSIHYTLIVSLVDMICGFKKTMTLYDGDGGELALASQGLMNPYTPQLIQGKGLPAYKTNEIGDLYIHYHITYPPEKTLKKMKPIFMKLFQREEVQTDECEVVLS